jgi:DNA-binding MarR family transcriptional regulator
MTGILDRLQRGGWITRERDPEGSDRRAVAVRALRDRNAELELLADFLRRTTSAGRTATDELAAD